MNRSTVVCGSMVAVLAAGGVAPVAALAGEAPNPASVLVRGHKARVGGQAKYFRRDSQGRVLYTVVLKAPPVARYHGATPSVAGFAPLSAKRGGDGKLNLQSAAARAYADHLRSAQDGVLADLRARGVALQLVASYQYALNGFSAWLDAEAARRLAGDPRVKQVHRVRVQPVLFDSGAEQIGAPVLWFGNPDAVQDTLFINGFEQVPADNRGAGVVMGAIDSGINFPSHAFDGAGIGNPLGSGQYLGWCNANYDPDQSAPDPCNDKVIGSWDFVYSLVQNEPNVLEYPGAMDEQNHGSHTASIAAGDRHPVTFNGVDLTLSGVAPEANLMVFDACFVDTLSHTGLCPGPATTAAVEQAVRDGVVDVLNFSIGGGLYPWYDPTSLAFLSAVDSGIFVAAAAGNNGPAGGSVIHLGPWVTTVAATTLSHGVIGAGTPQTPDVVAAFSARGPGWANLLKPDVAAPGVEILAAFGGGQNGDPDALGQESGTSMASPHVAGAAALVKRARPAWTPMEIKSALMLTAKPASQLTASDGNSTGPATPLDTGAGRVEVDQAVKAGLVMRESALDMLAANPDQGGDPSSLNLASLYHNNCVSQCSFQRAMTSTLPASQQWNIAASIEPPLTVSAPASIAALPGGLATPLAVSVDASAATHAGWYAGTLTLTPVANPGTPVLHMPIMVRVRPPDIRLSPESLAFTLQGGRTDDAIVQVNNDGGLQLAWSVDNSANHVALALLAQPPRQPAGYLASRYTPVAHSSYVADDFEVVNPVQLSTLSADGFYAPYAGSGFYYVDEVTFSIHARAVAANVPDGAPDGSGAPPVYTCTLPWNAAALTWGGAEGDGFTLDLATVAPETGCDSVPTLQPGTYWLMVYAGFNSAWDPDPFTGSFWYLFASSQGSASAPMWIEPGDPQSNGWATLVDAGGAVPGLAMGVDTAVDCGAAWLGPSASFPVHTPAGGSDNLTISVDATGLATGDHHAWACIDSNDPDTPVLAIPVSLTVTP